MANSQKDKPGPWAKLLSYLYAMVAKEMNSRPGRINLLMMFSLLAIILVYIPASTAPTIARVIASRWNPEFAGQTGDNIILLILAFLIPSVLCFIFMGFIIKEDKVGKPEEEDEDPVE